MEAIASFGLWNLVVPLFVWVPLFAVAAGLLGLSTVRRTRKQLVAANRPTRLPTALIGVLLLVLMPLAAGFLGGTFAFKRGLAHVVETGGDRVVGWSMARGAAALGVRDGHSHIHLGELRAKIHLHRHPPARASVTELPDLLEQGFWQALDSVATEHLTWDELVVRTRTAMQASVLGPIAAQLHAAAWGDLMLLGIVLVAGHAGVLMIVWLLCRRRLTVET